MYEEAYSQVCSIIDVCVYVSVSVSAAFGQVHGQMALNGAAIQRWHRVTCDMPNHTHTRINVFAG